MLCLKILKGNLRALHSIPNFLTHFLCDYWQVTSFLCDSLSNNYPSTYSQPQGFYSYVSLRNRLFLKVNEFCSLSSPMNSNIVQIVFSWLFAFFKNHYWSQRSPFGPFWWKLSTQRREVRSGTEWGPRNFTIGHYLHLGKLGASTQDVILHSSVVGLPRRKLCTCLLRSKPH